jgi:hypothetical protein
MRDVGDAGVASAQENGSARSGPSGVRPGKGERRRGPRQSGNERHGVARGRGASGRRRWWRVAADAGAGERLDSGARDWQVQEHGRRASATVAVREREQELGATGGMGAREQSARATTATELARTAPA